MPLDRVLARTDKVAVCVTRLAAYPTGFEFDIVTMSADDQDELDPADVPRPRLLSSRRRGGHPARTAPDWPDDEDDAWGV